MPLLPDITTGALAGDDPDKKLDSMARQVNEWGRLLSNEKRTDITKDDAGTPRLLIGYQKDGFSNGSVGVKLSQEGIDVSDATDDQLIWSSDFNMHKIIFTGTATIPSAGAGAISELNINLGATNLTAAPAYSSYLQVVLGPNTYSSAMPFNVGANTRVYAVTRITGGVLFIDGVIDNTGGGTPSGDYTFRYYIYRETGL